MARLRSLIGPSLISPQTKLIGVPTNGLQAVITLKIPLNQQSTHSYYRHSSNLDMYTPNAGAIFGAYMLHGGLAIVWLCSHGYTAYELKSYNFIL